jgi:hypothetical protein
LTATPKVENLSDPNFNVTQENSAAPTDISAPSPVAATPATPSAAAPTPAASPNPAITGQPPANPGAPPLGYVPSFRIRETRDQYEAKIASLEAANNAKIESMQRQLQALTGVTPQNQSEEDVIRQQLFKVVPQLQKLLEIQEKLESSVASQEELKAQQTHYWESYNRQQMNSLFKAAEETYGTSLSDGQRNYLKAAFVGWASNDPELASRYQNDPTLVTEFWKEFSSSFIDPARRQAVSNTAARVPANLPQDNPSGAVRTSQPLEPAKNADEVVDRAWATFKQLRSK